MWILSLGFQNEEEAEKGFTRMLELGYKPGTPHDYGYGPGSTALQRDLFYACGNALDTLERLYKDQEFRNHIHKDLLDQLRIAVERGSVEKPGAGRRVRKPLNITKQPSR